jgi:hypothetical protein
MDYKEEEIPRPTPKLIDVKITFKLGRSGKKIHSFP